MSEKGSVRKERWGGGVLEKVSVRKEGSVRVS